MRTECQPVRLPQGPQQLPDGSVEWRVWAPHCATMGLALFERGRPVISRMTPAGHGYYAHRAAAEEGARYAYSLPNGCLRPDPASRWQPEGIHRPSALYFPERFRWTDTHWKGLSLNELVIYELHVGTFTKQGTFEAIVPRLKELVELGVTAIEIMPIAQFPGDRNWGYDGVHPFAAQNRYGGPRGLQHLVNAAHAAGLGVILDVVYNHLGPEGNYLGEFGPYFTSRHHTPWGQALNFDGPDSDPVRAFVVQNACSWIRDFHIDGLRLDAVQTIFDSSARHILAELQSAVQQEGRRAGRNTIVIAETNQNDVRLVRPQELGGLGLDGMWCDDFHHSLHALLTGERLGNYQDFGHVEAVAKAYQDAIVVDGCYVQYRRKRHGRPAGDTPRQHFVIASQTHDHIGNRADAARIASLVTPDALRLAAGLMLLSPCTPQLFMGEEYGETNPFHFFCSFENEAFRQAVRRGRRNDMRHRYHNQPLILADPNSAKTFESSKLSWSWPEGSAALRQMYRDLLVARRRWVTSGDRRIEGRIVTAGGNGNETNLFVIELVPRKGILGVANFSAAEALVPPQLDTTGSQLLISTALAEYGGPRSEEHDLRRLFPWELAVIAPEA